MASDNNAIERMVQQAYADGFAAARDEARKLVDSRGVCRFVGVPENVNRAIREYIRLIALNIRGLRDRKDGD